MLSSCCLPGCRHLITIVAAAFALSAAVASPAQALQQESQEQEQPPQLSANLLRAESLTEQQQQQVTQFAEFYVDRIVNADDPAVVSDARQRLLDPLRNRAITQPPAHNAISDALAESLLNVLEGNSVHVRLNALILCAELSSAVDQIMPLLTDSLAHQHAAIRYRAARTIVQLSEPLDEDEDGSSLTTEQQTELLEALSAAMENETSDTAMEAMYEAVGSLTIPEARQVLLNVLDDRTGTYTGGVHAGLQADQRGIASLQDSLSYDRAMNRNVDDALRQLTVVAARLLDAVTRELQNDRVPEGMEPVAVRTVQSVEDVFDLAISHFAPDSSNSAQPLASLAEDGEYDDLRLNALEWLGSDGSPGLLSESAIAIPQNQLQLQAER